MLVIYESEESVSMVHGYTRTYSHHEIEEEKTISIGEEAGLVVRDNNEIRSFKHFFPMKRMKMIKG